VQTFIVDMCSGRIAYVLVALAGFPGPSDRWIPIPFEVLTWIAEKNRFMMDIPRKTIEKVPTIAKSEWPEKFLQRLEMENHSVWLETVYDCFNCTPYWILPGSQPCDMEETGETVSTKIETHFIPTSWLEPYDIVDETGKEIGWVGRIIMDMYSGKVAYVLASIPGRAEWVVIPSYATTWQPSHHRFRLDIPFLVVV
jgi:sporulation protein YlmC with PRC-barrel domain